MIRLLMLIFAFTALTAVSVQNVHAGYPFNETDAVEGELVGVFDLRDRETFIQVTNVSNTADLIHIQVFNLAESCGENDFFDSYTGNDTHLYDIRNLTANDGSDPGFTLPDDSYGFVVVTFEDEEGIGNMRIKDATGYEYRTNLQAVGNDANHDASDDEHWFNFNQEEGVQFSDIFGAVINNLSGQSDFEDGAQLGPITDAYVAMNVDMYNLVETLFSCRDLIFACTDGSDPLIPELLIISEIEEDDELGIISPDAVRAEFGLNEAIPSSRDASLICPNNTIGAGTVFFNEEQHDGEDNYGFVMFVGLNDGEGRGSFDSVWSGENEFDDD